MFARCICIGLLITFSLFCPQLIIASTVLNEILPNPSGSSDERTEFIELFNNGETDEDISGWKIDDIKDGGSDPYTIPNDSKIKSKGFVIFEKSSTKIALNNTDDTVRLLTQDGSEIDVFHYDKTYEDVSYGRTIDGEGIWTVCQSITRLSSNNCMVPSSTPTKIQDPTHTIKPTNTSKPSSTSKPTVTLKVEPTTKTLSVQSTGINQIQTKNIISQTIVNTKEETQYDNSIMNESLESTDSSIISDNYGTSDSGDIYHLIRNETNNIEGTQSASLSGNLIDSFVFQRNTLRKISGILSLVSALILIVSFGLGIQIFKKEMHKV
jgi:hypothetical protein